MSKSGNWQQGPSDQGRSDLAAVVVVFLLILLVADLAEQQQAEGRRDSQASA